MEQPRIALALNLQTGYCRRAVMGIALAAQRFDWVLGEFKAEKDTLDVIKSWQPTGVIGHILEPEFGRVLMDLGIPLVNISSSVADELPIPCVDSDHASVGKLAARYFWDSGTRNFAFFGSHKASFSIDRERGYREFLEKVNAPVSAFYSDYTIRPPFEKDVATSRQQLSQWASSLPTPTGVFCSNDEHARLLGLVAAELGIEVPAQLQLLGVDNDKTICHLSNPPLSSVDNPAEEIGYRAAMMMVDMIKQPGRRPDNQQVEAIRIISRKSTDRFAIKDSSLRRALRYIERNLAREELSVDRVARESGLSRRSLERKFNAVFDSTVLGVIHRLRIEKAQQLLRDTDLSVHHIAIDCGFSNHRRFGIVFKKLTGLLPLGYRNYYESDSRG